MTTADEGFRLSPGQRRLVRRGEAAARTTATIAVTGPVDPERLRAAAERVVQRHEALRSRLVDLPGSAVPLQAIGDPAAGGQTVLRSRPVPEGWLVDVDVAAPFLDAASCEVVLSDLVAAYADLAAGPLGADEPPQFPDVAEWLNEQLDDADERAEAHWAARRQAGDPRPGGSSRANRRLAGAGDRLRTVAAGGVPPEAMLAATWQAVLHGSVPGTAPLLGVVRDGRRFAELRAVVGRLEAVAPIAAGDVPELAADAAARLIAAELADADAFLTALPEDTAATASVLRWLPEPAEAAADGVRFRLTGVEPPEDPGIAGRARPDGPDLLLEVIGGDALALVERWARLTGAALDRPSAPLASLPVLSAAE
jgi:hypothetical protein